MVLAVIKTGHDKRIHACWANIERKALQGLKELLGARTKSKKLANKQVAKEVGPWCSSYRAYQGFSEMMLRIC